MMDRRRFVNSADHEGTSLNDDVPSAGKYDEPCCGGQRGLCLQSMETVQQATESTDKRV